MLATAESASTLWRCNTAAASFEVPYFPGAEHKFTASNEATSVCVGLEGAVLHLVAMWTHMNVELDVGESWDVLLAVALDQVP